MIRVAKLADLEAWARLRTELWPDSTTAEHRGELRSMLLSGTDDLVAFVAVDDGSGLSGFAEAALRRDYVNGCETSPVTFLEGIYVRPQFRGAGVGPLAAAVESWGRERGCGEFASDALVENTDSHAFHKAVGFKETERVVYFRKRL